MQINYDDMVRAEKEGLKALGWQLMRVTHRQVSECFRCLGVLLDKEQGDAKKVSSSIDELTDIAAYEPDVAR